MVAIGDPSLRSGFQKKPSFILDGYKFEAKEPKWKFDPCSWLG